MPVVFTPIVSATVADIAYTPSPSCRVTPEEFRRFLIRAKSGLQAGAAGQRLLFGNATCRHNTAPACGPIIDHVVERRRVLLGAFQPVATSDVPLA